MTMTIILSILIVCLILFLGYRIGILIIDIENLTDTILAAVVGILLMLLTILTIFALGLLIYHGIVIIQQTM